MNILSSYKFGLVMQYDRPSMERGICPIAAVCTVVELLSLKCFRSLP